MPILLRLAVRNLRQHLGKTLILGAIITLGVAVLLIGTTLMDTASAGIQQSFINNYTGDVIITGTARADVSIFGVRSVGGIDRTPVLPDYEKVWEYATALPGVAAAAPQITGYGLVRREGTGNGIDEDGQELTDSSFSFLFAIEPESYGRAFQNFRIERGRYLQSNEQGIMLSVDRLRTMYIDYRTAIEDPISEDQANAMTLDELTRFIDVGDQLRIIGGIELGFPKVQVLPVVGIYSQLNQVEGVGSELVTYVDPETMRRLLELGSSGAADVVLTETETALLAQAAVGTYDDIFADSGFDSLSTFDDGFFTDPLFGDFGPGDGASSAAGSGTVGTAGEATTAGASSNSPGGTATDKPSLQIRADSGIWHYILLRLDNPAAAPAIIAQLNQWFAQEGIPANSGDWKKAAGPFALTADVLRGTFNGAVILIGIVALLIMINTMFISVLERTNEIGTMRALGAQRSTVRWMFLWETLTVTTVFGVLGIFVGLLILAILGAANIEATNSLLQVIFAGRTLTPVISIGTIFASLLSVSVLGIIAHLFPVRYAVKIPPIRAMQSE